MNKYKNLLKKFVPPNGYNVTNWIGYEAISIFPNRYILRLYYGEKINIRTSTSIEFNNFKELVENIKLIEKSYKKISIFQAGSSIIK